MATVSALNLVRVTSALTRETGAVAAREEKDIRETHSETNPSRTVVLRS